MYPNGYTYRRTITVDNTKVSGASNLTNFPIVVSGTYSYLAVTGSGGNVTSSSGFDIIFTSDSDGSTQLDHEIEQYISTTGQVAFWVKIPTLLTASDTTIYMFYGNSSVVTSQENKSSLWSSYDLVYHLRESGNGTAGEFKDSTSNANDGKGRGGQASQTPTQIDYVIGKGQSFDGGDGIDFGDVSAYDSATKLSMEFWIRFNNVTNNKWIIHHTAVGGGPQVYTATDNGKNIYVGINDNILAFHEDQTALAIDTDYHVGITWNATGQATNIVINGVAQTINTHLAGSPANLGNPAVNFGLGAEVANTGAELDGQIDEVKILHGNILTTDWFATEYNNQGTPAAFYTIGLEEQATTTSSTSSSSSTSSTSSSSSTSSTSSSSSTSSTSSSSSSTSSTSSSTSSTSTSTSTSSTSSSSSSSTSTSSSSTSHSTSSTSSSISTSSTSSSSISTSSTSSSTSTSSTTLPPRRRHPYVEVVLDEIQIDFRR